MPSRVDETTKPSHRPRLILLLLVLLLTVVVSFTGCPEPALEDFGPFLEGGDYECLEAQGDRIRQALEAFREAHGRYPATFAEAGLLESDTQTKFGPWRLGASSDDPTRFSLAVGIYGQHNFALWWTGEDWYWDT